MRLHSRVGAVACAAAVVLAVAGCSSSGGDEGGKAAKPSRSAKPEPTADAGKVSEVWGPKLDKLSRTKAVAACNDVASAECADQLLKVREGLIGMGEALDEAGAGDYPKTTDELADVLEGWTVWQADGCAGAGGERCHGAALKVALGPANLGMTLITDEANAA